MEDHEYSEVDRALQDISSQLNSLRWKVSNMMPKKPSPAELNPESRTPIDVLRQAQILLTFIHRTHFNDPSEEGQNCCVIANHLAKSLESFIAKFVKERGINGQG